MMNRSRGVMACIRKSPIDSTKFLRKFRSIHQLLQDKI